MNILRYKQQCQGYHFCGSSEGGETSGGAPAELGTDYSFTSTETAGAAPSQLGEVSGNWSSSSGGTWSTGADGKVYGNLQDAARDLGVKPSELPGNSTPSWMSSPWAAAIPGATAVGAITKGIGYAQDNWGLPGYAMTPAERDAAAASARGDHGDAGTGLAGSRAASGAQGGAGTSSGGTTPWTYGGAGSAGSGSGGYMNYGDALVSAVNHDPAQSASYGWNRFLNLDQPIIDGQARLAIERGNIGYDKFTANADNADQDYNSIFRPSYQKLAAEVDTYGSADYQAQQRAQAMERVQGQSDQEFDGLRRQYAGMGVGSGALQDALASRASGIAMAKVAAATNSDNTLKQAYGAGLTNLANTGLNVANYGMTSRKNGLASGMAGLTAATDNAKLGLSGAQTAGQILDSRTAAANGTLNAQTNRQQANNDSDPWNTVLGAGVGAGVSALTKWALG